MTIEETLVLLKPDALKRNLIGDIISRFAKETQLDLVAKKVVKVDERLARTHYHDLGEKVKAGEMDPKIYDAIMQYIMGVLHDEGRIDRKAGWEHIRRKVVALVHLGENAVEVTKNLCGRSPHPEKCEPNSIRYQYGRVTADGVWENLVHASENVREAIKEVKLWFRPEEVIEKIEHPRFSITRSDGYYALLDNGKERLVSGEKSILQRGISYFIAEGFLYLVKKGSVYTILHIRAKTRDGSIENLLRLINEIDIPSQPNRLKKCGTLIICPHQEVWASDLRAMQEASKTGQMDYAVDLAIAKYLVPTHSYTSRETQHLRVFK